MTSILISLRFLQTPITSIFDFRVLLAFFSVSVFQASHSQFTHTFSPPLSAPLLYNHGLRSILMSLLFLETPTTAAFESGFLLAFFSVTCPSGLALQISARWVLRCVLFCSQNNEWSSIRIALSYNKPPSPLLSTSVSCSSSRCLVLQALHYKSLCHKNTRLFVPSFTAILSSLSYIEIIPALFAFYKLPSPRHSTPMFWPPFSRYTFFGLASPIHATRVLFCQLCCSHNHELTSILLSVPICRLKSLTHFGLRFQPSSRCLSFSI